MGYWRWEWKSKEWIVVSTKILDEILNGVTGDFSGVSGWYWSYRGVENGKKEVIYRWKKE